MCCPGFGTKRTLMRRHFRSYSIENIALFEDTPFHNPILLALHLFPIIQHKARTLMLRHFCGYFS
jgi:hypothetical protein